MGFLACSLILLEGMRAGLIEALPCALRQLRHARSSDYDRAVTAASPQSEPEVPCCGLT